MVHVELSAPYIITDWKVTTKKPTFSTEYLCPAIISPRTKPQYALKVSTECLHSNTVFYIVSSIIIRTIMYLVSPSGVLLLEELIPRQEWVALPTSCYK